MKKKVLAGLLSLFLIVSCGCGNGGELTQLIFDPTFSYGFKVQGTDYTEGVAPIHVFDYEGTASKDVEPRWTIGQWESKYDIGEGTVTEQDGFYIYEDPAKTLRVNPSSGAFGMDYRASAEWEEPRRPDQNWPGLLLQTTPVLQPALADMTALYAKFSFTLTKAECKMEEDQYNPDIHAAQMQWYLMITNNSNYTGVKGDYFWFGISIWDNRYEIMGEYIGQDSAGVVTSTNKFTYCFPQSNWLDEPIQVGKTYTVYYDVLPDIIRGFSLAQERGFLPGSVWENMIVGGMNIGWELPGIFDVGMDFDYIGLYAEIPQEE